MTNRINTFEGLKYVENVRDIKLFSERFKEKPSSIIIKYDFNLCTLDDNDFGKNHKKIIDILHKNTINHIIPDDKFEHFIQLIRDSINNTEYICTIQRSINGFCCEYCIFSK